MAHPVEDLVVYRLAVAAADEIYSFVAGWPSFDRWAFGLQLVRAADSVAANIAESRGRAQPADRRRFLIIARGSLWETEHWLKRAEARDLSDPSTRERIDEAGRALSGLLAKTAPSS